MTPAARIQTTIFLLDLIGTTRVPMDTAIGDYMRQRRYIGSKDRAAIAERIYSAMRHKARFDWWINEAGLQPDGRLKTICTLIFLDERAEKDILKLFDGSKYGPEQLSDTEIAFLKRISKAELMPQNMPEAVRVECPSEFEGRLREIFESGFVPEMAAMLDTAPLDLRVNTGLAPVDKAAAYLEADGVETDKTPYAPTGLRTKGKTYLSRTKAFAKGWIDIQDEGSQLIAVACDAKPGMQVLDYCAGAGGKTLALASYMEGKGRIVAMDNDDRRLGKSKERFKRARVSDSIEIRPLTDERHKKWLRRQRESFDITLIDVPCSGSGTWRRNPDMRWVTYGPELEELIDIQADIMERVAHTVKPGGKLVYATCSLFRAENENQVEAFLARHDEFELLPLQEAWPEGLTLPCEGPYMRLTPLKHGTDGFFAAVLRRKEESAAA
ncbi:MAG: RsmB/NOP family class I SAM-dependent RNA methyltransferase [Pseudobdellovibrionaceae bacterium]